MIIPNWHPVFVHFTVALSVTALLFMLLTLTASKESLRLQWRHSARWCLWLSAFFTIFTLLAGFQAFDSVAHDAISHQVMIIHRNWALGASVLLILVVFWSISCCQKGRMAGYSFLAGMLLLVVVITITAWYGAELVYRHGVGVMSLPDAVLHGEHSHIESTHHNNIDTGEASVVHPDHGETVESHDH